MTKSNWLLALALTAGGSFHPSTSAVEPVTGDTPPRPRMRVIVDNDFGGDCDGLFALAHHLLSPSVEVRGIVGSHQYPDGFYGYPGTAANACANARDLLVAMDLEGKIPIYAGAEDRLSNTHAPAASDAVEFIIREAMRDDATTPLVVVCGAGLTDLASAYLREPAIAKRLRLVWIGGPEYDGLATPPPGGSRVEYNLGIDTKAAQVIFNDSEIDVWQVPRDAYRQALVSHAELSARMDPNGKLASYLLGRLGDLKQRADHSLGEAYVLGDSPLVLLTALQSSWEPDPSSSHYKTRPAPRISDSGEYQTNPSGRPIRVYTLLDTRLMFEDFYAKVAAADHRATSNEHLP